MLLAGRRLLSHLRAVRDQAPLFVPSVHFDRVIDKITSTALVRGPPTAQAVGGWSRLITHRAVSQDQPVQLQPVTLAIVVGRLVRTSESEHQVGVHTPPQPTRHIIHGVLPNGCLVWLEKSDIGH